jgi:uncharacterized protein DUF6594
MGFPRLATFLDSDEDFMIYRRFGYIQSRLLIEKQEELRKLEVRLDRFDKKMEREKNEPILRTRDEDSSDPIVQERRALVDLLENKFCEYG